MKRQFTMNGKKYDSMLQIAKDLGKSRIYPKDFDKYGIVETTGQDDTQDTPVVAVEPEVTVPVEVKVEEPAKDTEEPKRDSKKVVKAYGTDEEIAEAEKIAKESTLEEFYSKIKNFTVDALSKMATTVGLSDWSNMENSTIRRMHLMADIKKYYFPNDSLPIKKKSVWSKTSLEDMLKLADSKGVEYKKYEDEKIQRMRVTVALNLAGLTPEDIGD